MRNPISSIFSFINKESFNLSQPKTQKLGDLLREIGKRLLNGVTLLKAVRVILANCFCCDL